MGKLPHRFLEGIYSSIRCYDDEDIEFPLECLPADLRNFVIEKMMYLDFANLNSCNTFTSKMCDSLSSSTKLPISVDYILCAEHILGENGSQIIEECIPKNVDFYCNLFRIEPQYWDAMKAFYIESDILDIFTSDYSEEFLKELLDVTQATELMVRQISWEMLELPEVTELDSIEFYCPELTEDQFLKLPNPTIIAEEFEPSCACLAEFIEQWMKGEREIVETRVMREDFMWSFVVKSLQKVFPFTKWESSEDLDFFWICRSEDHRDCIQIEHDYGERLEIKTQEDCPKAKK